MSLSALALDYTSRREQPRLAAMKLNAVAPTSAMSLQGSSATDGSGKTVGTDTTSQQFVQAIMKYIPTEIVSAYVVLLGLIPKSADAQAVHCGRLFGRPAFGMITATS
jgi:hypothetical protein